MGARMKAVFLSHTVEGPTFRVGSHHLAREFAIRGWTVAHVSTSYSPLHIVRRRPVDRVRFALARSGPRFDEYGVLHVVPWSPLPLSLSQARREMRRVLPRIGFGDADYVLVDQPLLAAAIGGASGARIVYRPTDSYFGEPELTRQRWLCERSDGIVATSSAVLLALGSAASGIPHLILPNGVEYSRFRSTELTGRSGLVYVGALDERFDWDAVRAIALAVPGETVTLAGPLPRSVPDLPNNVRLLGGVPYSSVPDLLRSARVGLLPFNDSPLNIGRSPMKYYEYAAAGLAILARATSELSSRSAGEAYLYESLEQAAVQARRTVEKFGDREASQNIEMARLHDWSEQSKKLASFLTSLPERVAGTGQMGAPDIL